MPSTLVHVAIGGLVGAALLGDRFTPKAIAVVLMAAAIPDVDSVVALAVPGAHRTLLHTFLLPGVVAAGLAWDTRWRRAGSRLRDRLGDDAVYVAWVALAALVVGGVLPDLATNGVNALWPLADQFYTVDGKLLLSDQRGVVQTFVELSPEDPKQQTSKNVRYSTGVNPNPWGEKPKEPPERVFPVASSGLQLLLVGAAALVVGVRTWQTRAAEGLSR